MLQLAIKTPEARSPSFASVRLAAPSTDQCCHEAKVDCPKHAPHRSHPVIVGLLALLDVLIFSAPNDTHAAENDSVAGAHLLSEFGFVLQRTRHEVRIQGQVETLEVLHRKDRFRGNYEVDVQIKYRNTINRFGFRSILRGRDLDGDGVIDAWFYLDDNHHIQAIDDVSEFARLDSPELLRTAQSLGASLAGAERWGLYRAVRILEERGLGTGKSLENRFGDWVLNYASWAYSRRCNVIAEKIEQEIRLSAAEMVANRLESTGSASDQARATELRSVTLEGWKEVEREARENLQSGIIKYVAADIAAYVFGAKVAQGVTHAAASMWGKALVRNNALRTIEVSVSQWIESSEARAIAAVRVLESKLAPHHSGARGAGARWAHAGIQTVRAISLTAREQSWQMVQRLEARGRLGRAASKSIKRVAGSGQNLAQAAAVAGGTRVLESDVRAMETWDKIPGGWNEMSADNVILIDRRVHDPKDLLYNVTAMTPGTLLLSNVRAYEKQKSGSLGSVGSVGAVGNKLTIGAVVSLVKRTALTAVLQNGTQRREQIFEAVWGGVVGEVKGTTDQWVRSRYALQGYALALKPSAENKDLGSRLHAGETFEVIPIFALRSSDKTDRF